MVIPTYPVHYNFAQANILPRYIQLQISYLQGSLCTFKGCVQQLLEVNRTINVRYYKNLSPSVAWYTMPHVSVCTGLKPSCERPHPALAWYGMLHVSV